MALAGIAAATIMMAGCVTGGNARSDVADGTAGNGVDDETQEIAPSGADSPWHDANDGMAAATGAGIGSGFSVPSEVEFQGEDMGVPAFRYSDGLAEAAYNGSKARLVVHKGTIDPSVGTISEDAGDYEAAWTIVLDGDLPVSCLGHEDGKAILAEWTVGEDAYSLKSYGIGGKDAPMTEDEIAEIVTRTR